MTREEAAAIVELRARLQHNNNPNNPGHVHPLLFAWRPQRSLPSPYQVVSFFVYVPKPPYVYELVDDFMKVLWPGPTAKYRWRAGGVREWDGLIWHTHNQDVAHFIQTEVSQRLFGSQHVMFGGQI